MMDERRLGPRPDIWERVQVPALPDDFLQGNGISAG